MTWRLDQPVTLQAGRGYSFAIMSTDPASCHFLYQTTWDHNGAQVEGGTNQCASGVRFGENDSVLLKRGWHTQGVSDGVYGPDGCAGSKWDPVAFPFALGYGTARYQAALLPTAS